MILQFILDFALTAGYLVLFLCFGFLVNRKVSSESLSVTCLLGFFLYFSLFHLLALPMKIWKWPLHRLTVLWSAVVTAVLLLELVFDRTRIIAMIREHLSEKKKWLFFGCLAIGTVLFALYIGLNRNTISAYDAAYYIGSPQSSVYSDTLGQMDAYTGRLGAAARQFRYYILNTDTLHSAMISQLTGVSSLAERKFCFSAAMCILFGLVLYRCGMTFFREEAHAGGKTLLLMLLSGLVLMESYSIAGVSHYFAYRTYEGKSIISYFYMSAMFLFALMIYREAEEKAAWTGLLLCTVSGVCFSNSALFVVPAMLGISMAPYVFRECVLRKKWRAAGRLAITFAPCLLWIVFYKLY